MASGHIKGKLPIEAFRFFFFSIIDFMHKNKVFFFKIEIKQTFYLLICKMKTTFPLEKKKKTLKCNLLKLVKHIFTMVTMKFISRNY